MSSVQWSYDWAPLWSRIAQSHRRAVRRRRSGGQLKVQVGRSTTSRQTTTGTNALEVDMPPCHQRDAVGEDTGGGHGANCATDIEICPNRARFALNVSKSPLRNWLCDGPNAAPRPARPCADAWQAVRHLHPRAVLRDS